MPRPLRNFVAGTPLHLVQRGNNRVACFYEHRDYLVYLEKMAEFSALHRIAIHSYVLMTNHVHLLLTPDTTDAPSKFMQALGRYYVRYFNSTYRRTGTLWEGRFKATPVCCERYFLTVSKYIELNPVRACMVNHPAEYPWSSYQHNAVGKDIGMLKEHICYQSLGDSHSDRQAAYRNLFKEQIPDYSLKIIREATNKQWVLGDSRFKAEIEKQLGYELAPKKRGGDRKSEKYQKTNRCD